MLTLASSADMISLLQFLLCGPALKLGFSCAGDLRLLGCTHMNVQHLLDVQTAWCPGKRLPLREVVLSVFGRPLCKMEQCSNWMRRPLRQSQMHYAALDAWCLLRCCDALAKSRSTEIRALCDEAEAEALRAASEIEDTKRKQMASKAAETEKF